MSVEVKIIIENFKFEYANKLWVWNCYVELFFLITAIDDDFAKDIKQRWDEYLLQTSAVAYIANNVNELEISRADNADNHG